MNSTTPRPLPIVTVRGARYFFDRRLRQLRRVDNPHEFRDLDEVEVSYYEAHTRRS